jgi:signal transduction histidine kinase
LGKTTNTIWAVSQARGGEETDMPGDNPPDAGHAASGGDHGAGDKIRARLGSRYRCLARGTMLAALCPPLAGLGASTAFAASGPFSVGTFEVIQIAVSVGVVGAALLSAIWLIRERARTFDENALLRGKVADLGAALQRAEAMLNLRDQRVVIWASDHRKPELIGSLPMEAGAPDERGAFLAFGRWLSPRSAAALDHAIMALRERAIAFDLTVETVAGVALEVQGRKTAQHVIVRFFSLSETHRSNARLKMENQRISGEHDTLLGLLDALRMPFWLRGVDGRLKWVNRAYASAVEADSASLALRDGKEFLGGSARDLIAREHAARPVFEQIMSTVIKGDRKVFTVTDFAGLEGSAGIAADVTDVESIREEHQRTIRSHADTLDQLNTAVAIFDSGQKLRFFNHAFHKLWNLDHVFLDSAPDNALLLDRLRSAGKLAEQPEWRRWKENLLQAYRSVDPQEHWWHLPDGRTIRVVANPQPNGGVTWVFEDLTERIDLESRYQTAVRVQGETLDNLAEGVSVFGPDGRVRLSNPAFATLWGIDPAVAVAGTHITAIRAACDQRLADSPWSSFVAAVTGFDEERRDRHGQAELRSGTVLRYAVIHLPNGQVMMTFVDVTDSVNVERALKDKNEALQKSDQLKNDFVQHVSYELRSPLTNIIGFTELLQLPATGALTERQREYVDHIGSSSSVLLTIVNDILDLATVDAGIMQLDLGEVHVEQAIANAVDLVSERLREHGIRVRVEMERAPKSFHGDENRVRQILFNLLSNAANYAPENSEIVLACESSASGVAFSVHDDGPGMPAEILDTVFRRFEPRLAGGRRRGAGLGLSIVKSFVELHGGTVSIDSAAGRGTTVTCWFPMAPAGARAAAE